MKSNNFFGTIARALFFGLLAFANMHGMEHPKKNNDLQLAIRANSEDDEEKRLKNQLDDLEKARTILLNAPGNTIKTESGKQLTLTDVNEAKAFAREKLEIFYEKKAIEEKKRTLEQETLKLEEKQRFWEREKEKLEQETKNRISTYQKSLSEGINNFNTIEHDDVFAQSPQEKEASYAEQLLAINTVLDSIRGLVIEDVIQPEDTLPNVYISVGEKIRNFLPNKNKEKLNFNSLSTQIKNLQSEKIRKRIMQKTPQGIIEEELKPLDMDDIAKELGKISRDRNLSDQQKEERKKELKEKFKKNWEKIRDRLEERVTKTPKASELAKELKEWVEKHKQATETAISEREKQSQKTYQTKLSKLRRPLYPRPKPKSQKSWYQRAWQALRRAAGRPAGLYTPHRTKR